VSGGRGEAWDLSEHALWWPPSKIAGRWLAPYLALHHEEPEGGPAGLPVEVSLDSLQGPGPASG
jgi:sulfide:quinone oxidoreductase